MADLDDPDRGRFTIPLLMGLLIALYAGSRIEQAREPEALILALACPVACAWLARQPFADAYGPTRLCAELGAGLTLLVALGRICFGLFGDARAQELARASWLDVASLALGVAALGVEYGARRRAIRSRYTAWLGCALAAAAMMPRHAADRERFPAIFGALFVGFLAGGGAGLLLGAWVQHLARPRRD